MDANNIKEFLIENIKPIPNHIDGNLYPASAKLKDGFYLPCVLFQSSKSRVDLAIRRFEETKGDQSTWFGYRSIVRNFVTSWNIVADYQIEEVALCPFAIPADRYLEIHGETGMGWTGFTTVMKDGKEFSYVTTDRYVFLDLPQGYSGQDIVGINPHAPGGRDQKMFGEKSYFNCYLEGM